MEPDALSPGSSPYYDFVYNNEADVQPLYWPLVISQNQVKRAANELYNDSPAEYIAYSGSWQSLLVAREKEGRYKNFTLRAYSGDSLNFYLSIPSGQSSLYYASPLTSSGVYSILTEYTEESDAQQNTVFFEASVDNTRVYTLPAIKAVDWIRLHHKAVTSGESYRIYQFLPRTLIQVDDLEADVIDAVTIRVQDSIVIGPNLIGDKTILGQKIVDGTVSGILLTDGTITGSKIQANTISGVLITAGTITADRIASKSLTAGQIADATITGSLIQAGTVSGVLITDNAISASKIQANTITGDKIAAATISGSLITANTITTNLIAVSGINADRINATSLSAIATNTGSLTVSGTITVSGASSEIDAGLVKIDQTGIVVGTAGEVLEETNAIRIIGYVPASGGGNVVGLAMYNSVTPNTPQAVIQLDWINALEIESLAPSGIVNINIPQAGPNYAFNVWLSSYDLPRFSVGAERSDFYTPTVVRNDFSTVGGAWFLYDNAIDFNLTAQVDNLGNATFNELSTNGAVTTYGTFEATSTATFSGPAIFAGNITQDNYGVIYKNTAQSLAAGANAQITFQLSLTGGNMDNVASNRLDILETGLYLITGGVVSATTGSIWQIITGTAYNSGVLVFGPTQSNMSAYAQRLAYLGAGTVLRLWVLNSSAGTMAITTGVNGTILSAVKVG